VALTAINASTIIILALMIMQQTRYYISMWTIRHNISTHRWICGPLAQCQ